MALLCLSTSSSSGQMATEPKPVHVEACASRARLHPGQSFQVVITATIKQGFHINSNKPTDEFLIPTVVSLDQTKGIVFDSVRYPEPQFKVFSYLTGKRPVYEGKISIVAQGKVLEGISPGDIKLSGSLRYQACDDRRCFVPDTVRFEVSLKIVETN